MSQYEIRKVKVADAAQIADIYNHYILETTASFESQPLSVHEMELRIEEISREHPYIVCVDGNAIAGYAYAHPWKERQAYSHTWENTVYLHPDFKGRGLGRKLMTRLMEECKCLPVHVLIACITSENTESIEFHMKLGFEIVSHFVEVGYKFGRWLDVIDMQCTLKSEERREKREERSHPLSL